MNARRLATTLLATAALLAPTACTPEQQQAPNRPAPAAPDKTPAKRKSGMGARLAEMQSCDAFRGSYSPEGPMSQSELMWIVEAAQNSPAISSEAIDLAQAPHARPGDGIPTWRQAGEAFAAACARVGR